MNRFIVKAYAFIALLLLTTTAYADHFYWVGSYVFDPDEWDQPLNWNKVTDTDGRGTGVGIDVPGSLDHALIHNYGASQLAMPVVTSDVGRISYVTPSWHAVTSSLTFKDGARMHASNFYLSEGAGGVSTLYMQGGKLTADVLVVGGNGSGTIELDGGTIETQSLVIGGTDGGTGTGHIDITDGTLIVGGRLDSLIADDSIFTAYGGTGRVTFEFNVPVPGKSTIFATTDRNIAWGLIPANGAQLPMDMVNPLELTWYKGDAVLYHDVYIGTDEALVDAADRTTASIYQGRQTQTLFNATGLNPETTYYWRIDEVNFANQVFKGEVRSFTTGHAQRDLFSDTWVATDALGREVAEYAECGPRRDDRTIGIFYFTWHGYHENGEGPFDVSKVIAEHPFDDPDNPWANEEFFGSGTHWWGESEAGYFVSDDEWVIRRNMSMLTEGGVEVLMMDATNAVVYDNAIFTLCETIRKMRFEGNKIDIKIVFTTHAGSPGTVTYLYNTMYKPGLYPEMWYYVDGKPLILGYPDGIAEDDPRVSVSDEVREFFTWRESWYRETGEDRWPWMDGSPQDWGWSARPDVAEHVPVAVASHPLGLSKAQGGSIGRSTVNGQMPPYNEYHLPVAGTEDEGLQYAEQMGYASQLDPQFIFLTGWNEWTMGRYFNTNNWNIYLLGNRVPDGGFYFVDLYNEEFSRDIEPMKGGYTDSYYFQMVDFNRRYQGMRQPQPAGPPTSVDIDGDFGDWEPVWPEFRDVIGDTFHRNARSYRSLETYINTTGRNDFTTMKVTRDSDNIYFYCETRDPITPHTDPNWMLLFIDADHDNASGWEGYDYVVNFGTVGTTTTTLMHTDGGWNWELVSDAIPYVVNGNMLELAIPRAALGLASDEGLVFDFHWSDNMQHGDDIIEFSVSGDSAPSRRFNYRYQVHDVKRTTLREDDFEQGRLDHWQETDWVVTEEDAYQGTASFECGPDQSVLVTRLGDVSQYETLDIRFRYKVISASDSNDVSVYYNNGSNWEFIKELSVDRNGVWLYFHDVLQNSPDADARFFDNFQLHIQGQGLAYSWQAVRLDDFEISGYYKTDEGITPPATEPWGGVVEYLLGQTFDKTNKDVNQDQAIDIGDVHSMIAAQPPSAPLGAFPALDAMDVPTTVTLTWDASERGEKYDIYLWAQDDSEPGLPTELGLTEPAWTPDVPFLPETLYYWYIVARNTYGTARGETWHFTTAAEE